MARMLLIAAVAVALLAVASASCPNQCSGHGTCAEDDICVCYTQAGTAWDDRVGWTGADCSQRTCPQGVAWDRLATQSQRAITNSIKFVPATTTTTASIGQLRVYVTSTYNGAIDRVIYVRVSRSDAGARTFEWKWDDEDNYHDDLTMRSDVDLAQDLGQAGTGGLATATDGSGVRVYWDAPADTAEGDYYEITVFANSGDDFYPRDVNTAHQKEECSGRGSCDRRTGECVCDSPYEGEACARTVCPNLCSGHGICQTEKRFAEAGGSTYTLAWDATKHMGCECDAGYRGPDCSMKECPSGVNPLGNNAAGGAEGMDCSGRGNCDYTNGICSCFKGYFGERCEFQTNFL